MTIDTSFLDPYKQLLRAGFPRWQVMSQVQKHVEGLQALPADTPDRDLAIVAANEYLAELQALPPEPDA